MLGWLHAVPQPPRSSQRAKAAEPNKLSRLDQMRREGVDPQLPPNPSPQIFGWFTEIGMIEAGGMAPAALSWREINEWQRATAIDLPPWIARLFRRLSVEYLDELRRAESETRPAPWRGKVTQSEVDAELSALIRVLG
jgi:hypothetical protein